MALANTAWDDYSFGRSVSRSRRPARGSFGVLVAGALVAASVFGGVSVWRATESSAPAAAVHMPAGPAGGRTNRLFAPLASPFERNAEGFLRDSLLLSQPAEFAAAPRSGRFGVPGIATSPGNAPLATSLPFQQSFGWPVAVSPAPMPLHVNPEVATTSPAAAAPPVHVAPSVVVPLPPVFYAPAPVSAPVPAARLDRSAGSTTVVEEQNTPAGQASPHFGTRLPTPAPSEIFGRNDGVAIYDISAATVYLPNGQRLEAHSGMGPMVDNPRFADRINTGPTPPNIYNLIMRKGRFHGVEALRLIPADGNNRFGRVGLLAHTYLLRGRPAESNGCVAFKDYSRFLDAFKRGLITRLIVVPTLARSPLRVASAGNT